MAQPPIIFDDEARGNYLETLMDTGLPHTAARQNNIPIRVVNSTRKTDPEFEAAYDEALEIFAESVEAELIRRAMHGVETPIFAEGAQVGTVVKYSDALMQLLIKTKNPKYNEKRQTDVNVTGGVLLVAAPTTTAQEWLAAGATQGNALPAPETAQLPPPTQIVVVTEDED